MQPRVAPRASCRGTRPRAAHVAFPSVLALWPAVRHGRRDAYREYCGRFVLPLYCTMNVWVGMGYICGNGCPFSDKLRTRAQ